MLFPDACTLALYLLKRLLLVEHKLHGLYRGGFAWSEGGDEYGSLTVSGLCQGAPNCTEDGHEVKPGTLSALLSLQRRDLLVGKHAALTLPLPVANLGALC